MKEKNQVKVVMLTPFEKISGKREIEVAFRKGDTFEDLVEKLIRKFGKDCERTLMSKENRIDDDVMVVLAGKNISARSDSGFKELLKEDQEYVFCSVISGG